ncbi:MAG: glycoside hydrolase family 76 protein [Prevotella sp.]|jgi:hypothetical protein
MKKIFALIFLPQIMMAASCGGIEVEPTIAVSPDSISSPEENIVYKDYAKLQMDNINQYFLIRSGKYKDLYLENYPVQNGDPEHTYLWAYVGLLSGSALLHQMGLEDNYANMAANFDRYYSAAGEVAVGGYSSSTNGTSGQGTRFYDDNSITGLELLSAYTLLKDDAYLEKAGRVVTFLKSGIDDVLGGGLWWNESQKNQEGVTDSNKPTCANGYATNFLLNYYKVCPQDQKKEVLALAQGLYSWLVSNLQDPEDKTYWNDRQVDGSINKTKWTYNSGVMVSNGVLLYQITGEQSYLTQAIETAEGAYNYFVRPRAGMALAYPDHDPWFNTKLLKAYIDLSPYYKNAEKFIDTYASFMNNAILKGRLSSGLYYEDWTGSSPKRAYSLLTQDAALESLCLLSIYKGEQ